MNITIRDNVWAQAPPGPLRTKAAQLLRYRPQGYRFSPKYQHGTWDGFIRLVTRTGHFPAGLTWDLLAMLEEAGYDDVGVVDERRKPEPHPTIQQSQLLVPLNEPQQRAVEAAEQAERGIVEHPTGSGKGRLVAAISRALGTPTLILVHRKLLLKQVVDELRESLDIPACVGMVGAGVDEPGLLTVATFQTLQRKLSGHHSRHTTTQMLAKFGTVIIDESHHAGGAKTFEAVLKACVNAYYRIGLSATAHRSDDATRMRVTGWLGPIEDKMTVTEGIELGRIVPADVFIVAPGGEEPKDLPWQERYTAGIVKKESRNKIIVEAAARLPGLSMILVERIAHGRTLARMLHDRSSEEYAFIDGSDTESRRETVLHMARTGLLKILIGTEILGEGVNVPAVRNLIVARAGRAPHRTIQAVGRGTRAHEGKDRVVVLDFADRDWKWSRAKKDYVPGPLTTQAGARRKTYESEEAYSVTDIGFEEMMEWLT